jgi:pilus assembly protein Flp/PilA
MSEASYNVGPAMRKLVLRFVKDNTGATSIEYALIAGFLSILIIAGVNSIGTTVKGTFNTVANALQ